MDMSYLSDAPSAAVKVLAADTDTIGEGEICACGNCGAALKIVCPKGCKNPDVRYREKKQRTVPKTRRGPGKPLPTEKKCKDCGKTKPVSMDAEKSGFYLQNNYGRIYVRPRCKPCDVSKATENRKPTA